MNASINKLKLSGTLLIGISSYLLFPNIRSTKCSTSDDIKKEVEKKQTKILSPSDALNCKIPACSSKADMLRAAMKAQLSKKDGSIEQKDDLTIEQKDPVVVVGCPVDKEELGDIYDLNSYDYTPSKS